MRWRSAKSYYLTFYESLQKGLVLNETLTLWQNSFLTSLFLSLQDSYQLAWELDNAWEQSIKSGSPIDIDSSLRR